MGALPVLEVVEADLSDTSHARAVVRLLDAYARDPMGGGEGLSDYARENLVPALREHPGAHILLACADGEAVGLLNSFEGFSTFACRPLLNIHDVFVAESHRGMGICSRLLEGAQAVAERLGCCKLTLEVLEGNTGAQAAYRAAGFAGYALDPEMGKALFWEKAL
jgi:GNAT superfamily N-acetyltransferase